MRTQSWDALGDRPKVGWMFGPTSDQAPNLFLESSLIGVKSVEGTSL